MSDSHNSAVVSDAQLVRNGLLGCTGCPHWSKCGAYNIGGNPDWLGGNPDWPCLAALERLEA